MTTGLVWLKKADWGDQHRFWVNYEHGVDAQDRAAHLWDGSPYEGTAGLSDGSVEGDWRLPTLTEPVGITVGDEYIRDDQMYFFTGVQSVLYWSCTISTDDPIFAWTVSMGNGWATYDMKSYYDYVWPVRSDN